MIGIRTCAVKRAMEVQEVILRAIDGRVKWYLNEHEVYTTCFAQKMPPPLFKGRLGGVERDALYLSSPLLYKGGGFS